MTSDGDLSAEGGDTSTGQSLQLKGVLHLSTVIRRGNIIVKDGGPWSASTHGLLRHLEAVGFTKAPQIVGTGFDDQGRETLTYLEGQFLEAGLWSLDAAAAIGMLARELHDAVRSFQPPQDARWFPWFGRVLGTGDRLISHCDFAPWNIVARSGRPVALIDWERAGPVDPLVELVQACWLNAKLHDDVVAEREGLPPFEERLAHLRAIVDGYGLSKARRRGLVDLMIEFVIGDTASQADDGGVTGPGTGSSELAWAFAWRARAASTLFRHRQALENALA